MFSLSYGSLYKMPATYEQPDDAVLAVNTEYPNLNSRDYAKRPLNRTLRMHCAWECLTMNEEQQAIVATNKLEGREWTGSLWGFEDLEADLTPETANFKLQCNSLITQLQFVAKNIFLLSLHSGKVQVWSTRSEMRSLQNPYCLFLIGEKCEHAKPISCMDVMKSNVNKAATGSMDGTIKIWDMGSADLFSTSTYRFAHTDVITGVDSSNKDDCMFATCSLDKSALLWDDRLTRPATAIYENHELRFKTIAWASPEHNPEENLIYLGDEAGYIYTVDKRLPNEFVSSVEAFDRPIRKVLPNGDNFAVIGDTNCVKIFNAAQLSVVYENADAQHFVRDAVWSNAKELYTVGYEAKLRVHKIV